MLRERKGYKMKYFGGLLGIELAGVRVDGLDNIQSFLYNNDKIILINKGTAV